MDITPEKFEAIFQTAQGLITEFAHVRMQEKQKEAIARDGENIPSLEEKMRILHEMTGEEEKSQETIEQTEEMQSVGGAYINEYGEIIRPERDTERNFQQEQIKDTVQPTLRQRMAQFLQRNHALMNVSFIEKFVNKQLHVLPPTTQVDRQVNMHTRARNDFINQISGNGRYRNLPPIQRMSDPEKLESMRRKMQQQENENQER